MPPDVGRRRNSFEDHIAAGLIEHAGHTNLVFGNQARDARDFDPQLGLNGTELFTFIGATQQRAWEALVGRHGDQPTAQRKFKQRVAQELNARGTVDVLRHGVTDLGVHLRLAYFRPASGLNPELEALYAANRLTVCRQFAYEAESSRTIDLALLVNGLLVATAELKNAQTGQSIEDAVRQYRVDRDPKNVALSRRAVVHFAVDTELVQMTTRLAGQATRFLPFNLGSPNLGAGNPANPHGHRTAYLWERVWQRDAWLDLIARFIHVEKPAKGSKGPARTIFPRFHQWDAVRRLEEDARVNGAGHNYLVQHSAGSGKSNTIAWLAHRLSSLHDDSDQAVFDKVIVITDRRVLDRQLQDTIYQFEHTHGVVVRIDQDSRQLAEALQGVQARIIITTLQKFPFVLEKVESLPARRYAVIVDEAHSSQTGDSARDLKLVLADATPEEELGAAEAEDRGLELPEASPAEEALGRAVRARGRQANLSFFAFTATPKGKTLELFGTPDPQTAKPVPFHLYPMKQAIEEGFILDVLANYTTYETYWRIGKAIADDPEYATAKARRAIARFVSLHAVNLSQRAEVIVEHFRQHVAGRIDGRAKAMVVTASRLHAVRYAKALRAYISQHGYPGIGVLAAVSGTVVDGGADWSESALNGFPESQTAERFDSDEFQILVVAEKYQTGFDQPKLYAMYVDRTLTGIAAVQTLSRLNRTMEDKDGTVVLDFRNEADDIRAAFEPYYGATTATPTDPNLLYDSRARLDEYGVLRADEIAQMTDLLMAPPTTTTHGRIHAALTPAVDRFHGDLDEDRQEEFRDALDAFVRTYAFLSQLVNFGDTALERDYLFSKALARMIRRAPGEVIDLGDEVELTHLRQEMAFEGSIDLTDTEGVVQTILDGAGRQTEPDQDSLSSIINQLNERYGLNLTEADALHLDSVAEDLIADPQLQQQAAANSRENFGIAFEKRYTDALVQRLASNEDLTYRVMGSDELRADVIARYLPLIYGRARVANQEHCPIGELMGRPEDAHLEKKSSFRWDIVKGEKSKNIETATLKTVAAFLNSPEGGTLLIGVADDSEPLGLEADYLTLRKEGKDDADLFQLALHQAVMNAVGPAAATNVGSQIHAVGGLDICRVHVKPSSHPVHATVTTVAKDGNHEKKSRFYVRMGNGTREISDEAEVQKFIAGRWGKAELPGPG
ncbi:MAG: RNA-binding domain-containing protein [Thermoleophilia bacterium]